MADPFEIFNGQTKDSDFANSIGTATNDLPLPTFPTIYRFVKPHSADWFASPTSKGTKIFNVGDVIMATSKYLDGGTNKQVVYTTLDGKPPTKDIIGGVSLEIPLDKLVKVPPIDYGKLRPPVEQLLPREQPYLSPRRFFTVFKVNRPYKVRYCVQYKSSGINPCSKYEDRELNMGDVIISTGDGAGRTANGISYVYGSTNAGGFNGGMIEVPRNFVDVIASRVEASDLKKYTEKEQPTVAEIKPKSDNKALIYVGVAIAGILLFNTLKK